MKCDLHRHLSGSVTCETVSRISGVDLETVHEMMTYKKDEPKIYESFFDKFKIFDKINWTFEKIDITINDIIWSLKKESIDYAEIKFSITKYLDILKCSPEKLITWMAYRFEYHASNFGIEIDLILCLKHDMDKQKQIEISSLIKNDKIAECLSGIDVVGNEKYFEAEFYVDIFKLWNEAGKACMLHIGEIYNPINVRKALKLLKIDRICHGIAVADDIEVAKYTRDNLISFDICPTSNILTGVAKLENHPVLQMLENGFILSVGTDDPVILNTNLDNEYKILQDITKLSDQEIDLIKNAAYSLSARSIIDRKIQK